MIQEYIGLIIAVIVEYDAIIDELEEEGDEEE